MQNGSLYSSIIYLIWVSTLVIALPTILLHGNQDPLSLDIISGSAPAIEKIFDASKNVDQRLSQLKGSTLSIQTTTRTSLLNQSVRGSISEPLIYETIVRKKTWVVVTTSSDDEIPTSTKRAVPTDHESHVSIDRKSLELNHDISKSSQSNVVEMSLVTASPIALSSPVPTSDEKDIIPSMKSESLTLNPSNGVASSRYSNILYVTAGSTSLKDENGYISQKTTYTRVNKLEYSSYNLTVRNFTEHDNCYSPYQSIGIYLPTKSQVSPTLTSPSASPSSDLSGQSSSFVLSFDDIPPLAIGDQPPDSVQPMPIFNPYHQFHFSEGFTVVPPPTDPYLPSSDPLLLEYIPSFSTKDPLGEKDHKTLGYGISGGIGNGDHGRTGCFAFDALKASFGCDSTGPDCNFSFSGFRYDKSSLTTTLVSSQRQSIKACPSLKDCRLTTIQLESSFKNLDLFRINATVAGQPKIWWIDDIFLSWSNNTSAAVTCRLQTHIH